MGEDAAVYHFSEQGRSVFIYDHIVSDSLKPDKLNRISILTTGDFEVHTYQLANANLLFGYTKTPNMHKIRLQIQTLIKKIENEKKNQ
jgi:hypothetical protein